jgi:hypothetical protein
MVLSGKYQLTFETPTMQVQPGLGMAKVMFRLTTTLRQHSIWNTCQRRFPSGAGTVQRSQKKGVEMQTADIVLISAVLLCAIGFAALSIVLMRVFDALRALRREVRDMREQTLPLIADLRSSTDDAKSAMHGARADLERFDRVLGSAEAISEAVETSGRAARRLFAAPVIKAVGTVTGVKRAVSRMKSPGTNVEVIDQERRRA